MPERRTRRQCLTAVGLISIIGNSGCLRLTDTGETEQQEIDQSDSQSGQQSTEQSDSQSGQQSTEQSEPVLQVASKTGTVSDGVISQIEMVVLSSGGNVNVGGTIINAIDAEGTNTLTYDSNEAQPDSTFTLEAIQDEDDSLPVMTDADRFGVIIDPGTLEPGDTMTLEMTTEAGSTTQVRVSVPNTLSDESAVQV
jgi:flagellin FlaA/flagellin FlaB